MPHALSKTGLEELIVQHISIIKFLAPVWRCVTPVSDFQETLGYEYPAQIEKEFEGNLTTVHFDTFPNKLCLTQGSKMMLVKER